MEATREVVVEEERAMECPTAAAEVVVVAIRAEVHAAEASSVRQFSQSTVLKSDQ